jgi:Non-ribosomal peptide synthetase modules and related proteins
LAFLYKTQLFKEETIHRMWQHIVTLMQHVVDQPNTPINKLNVLTKQEKHKIAAKLLTSRSTGQGFQQYAEQWLHIKTNIN